MSERLHSVSHFQSAKLSKMLGDEPNLVFAGANVNLTITTDCLTIVVMESGNVRFTENRSFI